MSSTKKSRSSIIGFSVPLIKSEGTYEQILKQKFEKSREEKEFK
jgi:hypothetical protein